MQRQSQSEDAGEDGAEGKAAGEQPQLLVFATNSVLLLWVSYSYLCLKKLSVVADGEDVVDRAHFRAGSEGVSWPR